MANPMMSVKVVKKKTDEIGATKATEPVNNAQPTIPQEPKPVIKDTTKAQGMNVKFNDDGSVNVTDVGGNTQTISKQDYIGLVQREGGFQEKRGGTFSPQVQNFIKLNEQEKLKRMVSDRLAQGATMAQIEQELLTQEAQKRQTQQTETTTQADVEAFNQEQANIPANNGDTNGDGKLDSSEKFAIRNQAGLEEAGKVVQPLAKFTASAYDFVYSLTQGGKGIQQREAEQTFGKIEADFAQDLTLVKSGLKDANEVRNKIKLAQSAIGRLEASQKGIGKYNLRYFLTDGADIEAMISINRDTLKEYEQRLNMAEAQAGFGQQ